MQSTISRSAGGAVSSSSSDIALSRALHSRVQHSLWSAAAGASEQHTVAWLGSAELYSMPGDHAARLGLGSGACAALSLPAARERIIGLSDIEPEMLGSLLQGPLIIRVEPENPESS